MIQHDPLAKLLKNFNNDNNIDPPMQLHEVEFVDTRIELNGACNSVVTLVCLGINNRFTGSKTIAFNRYSIDHVLRGMVIPGKATDYLTLYGLLDVLREVYGMPFYRSDFVNFYLAADASSVLFKPTPNSVVFLPLTEVTLNFQM